MRSEGIWLEETKPDLNMGDKHRYRHHGHHEGPFSRQMPESAPAAGHSPPGEGPASGRRALLSLFSSALSPPHPLLASTSNACSFLLVRRV